MYVWHLHSFVYTFYEHLLEIEQSKASIVEIVDCLNSVKSIIKGREKEKFAPLKVKSMLRNLREDGSKKRARIGFIYDRCVVNLQFMFFSPLTMDKIFY